MDVFVQFLLRQCNLCESPTSDILLYLTIQAAQYAIKRRQLAEELCGDVTGDYLDPDPLANSGSLEFYGQRLDFCFPYQY